MKAAWFSLILPAVAPLGLSAAEYYVSPSGNDGNPGSLREPMRTLQAAASRLRPGDTLFARGGSYGERLLLDGKSGTPERRIVIRGFPGETARIDGGSLVVPSSGEIEGLVRLNDCSHLTFQGFTVCNFRTSRSEAIPAGIEVQGASAGLELRENKIHHISQESSDASANGFGIAVYGTGATPITNLVIDGNELSELRTGQSESLVLNGNVTNFRVTRNRVHDCNNIGIDFIGFERTAPAAVDRARDGACSGNIVFNIDTAFNPGYGGSFTKGGGERCAAGIYVDGGARIVIERNHVFACNLGVELASEHAHGSTEAVTLRNNLLRHNHRAGLSMGGYDGKRGATRNCRILNNVFYQNDTAASHEGQVSIAFFFENNTFKNNLLWAGPTGEMIINRTEGGPAAKRKFRPGNRFDYNVYFAAGTPAPEPVYGLNPTGSGPDGGNRIFRGLAAWREAVGGEAHSLFANPCFAAAEPSADCQPADFRLTAGSPAREAGSPGDASACGEADFFGSPRVVGGRVDAGFHEFAPAR